MSRRTNHVPVFTVTRLHWSAGIITLATSTVTAASLILHMVTR